MTDWTLVEEDVFEELLKGLAPDQRTFIVAEVIPPVEHSSSGVSKPEPGAALEVESSVSQFDLNLDALPRNVQLALKEPQPLPPRERRQLVRGIIDDMYRVSIRPRRDFIRSVAKAIVRHFPASLEDRGIDGKVLGRGYDSLLQQLENRVENESRRDPRAPPTVTLKTARKHSYGCANWQPLDLQPAQTTDERIQFLKKEGRKALRDVNVPLALTHMEATYSEQRSYINSEEPTHNISEIKEEWPLLFHKPFFYRHAYQLLGKDVKGIFEDNLRTIAPLLVKHLHTLPAPRREVLEWIVKMELQEKRGNQKAREEATIPLLAAYFKDCAGHMVRVLEEGASVTEVMNQLPPTPVILALGDVFNSKCFVACEQQLLLTESTSFTEAVCLAFLCYYVFNKTYPKQVSTTLEFIQRQLCGINPTKGKKSDTNTRTTVPVKVMKLTQCLRRECE